MSGSDFPTLLLLFRLNSSLTHLLSILAFSFLICRAGPTAGRGRTHSLSEGVTCAPSWAGLDHRLHVLFGAWPLGRFLVLSSPPSSGKKDLKVTFLSYECICKGRKGPQGGRSPVASQWLHLCQMWRRKYCSGNHRIPRVWVNETSTECLLPFSLSSFPQGKEN